MKQNINSHPTIFTTMDEIVKCMDDETLVKAAKEDREAMEKLHAQLTQLNTALRSMNDETKRLEEELDRLDAQENKKIVGRSPEPAPTSAQSSL